MQPKEKLTDVVASSLHFESFPENFTFAFKTQMAKTFISIREMSYETHQ